VHRRSIFAGLSGRFGERGMNLAGLRSQQDIVSGGSAMNSGDYRAKAERCRVLRALAAVPDIKEQLTVWEHEFDEIADGLDRRARRRQKMRSAGTGCARR
jgi:hypothetical protein